MRRDDRAVTDIEQIYAILEKCTSLSLGINSPDFPYVIPMTFGCGLEEGKIVIYLHCAGEGRKLELLGRDPRVCVEAHIYDRVEEVQGGITARFESVIGTGTAVCLTEREEKVAALQRILEHYQFSGFPVTSCRGLKAVEVYRVVLDEVCGKRNL